MYIRFDRIRYIFGSKSQAQRASSWASQTAAQRCKQAQAWRGDALSPQSMARQLSWHDAAKCPREERSEGTALTLVF